MSHLAVDLKVLEVLAPGVARAAGVSEDRVLAGLLRLWHRCWSTKSTAMTRTGLAATFGPEAVDQVTDALVDAGFLEVENGAWRVRGADRYLRISEGKSKGGKAAAGNLRRGNQPGVSRESAGSLPGDENAEKEAPSTPSAGASAGTPSRESAGDQPGEPPGRLPALHRAPSTEHRTPVTKQLLSASDVVDGASFFAWAQDERQRVAGLVPETGHHPRDISTWSNEAMMGTGGDFERLKAGYRVFLMNPYWRNEAENKCAWKGWVRQWRKFVPSTVGGVATPLNTRSPVAAESVDWSQVKPGRVQL